MHYLVGILSAALMIALACACIAKTGHPWWLGFLILVPLANFMLIVYLVAMPWPVELELAERRLADGEGGREEGLQVMGVARRKIKQGRRAEAIRLLLLVEARFAGEDLARDAEITREAL